MCTTTKTFTLTEIKEMATKYMNTTFTYDGRDFNLVELGWEFKFNSVKRALGKCKRKRSANGIVKTIELSKWLIENTDNSFDTWINTMLHEIAHAIDFERRNTSKHDTTWRNIALSIGCNGNRCSKVDYKADIKSKYTLKCNSCGWTTPSHKKRKRLGSCGKCSGGRYNPKYIIEQIQNY
tara:strand:+ start:152 stop:691 length:540 start_codon:yes stop_codon:yes gene_type:complete